LIQGGILGSDTVGAEGVDLQPAKTRAAMSITMIAFFIINSLIVEAFSKPLVF
jgi:hypothetical protein